MHNFLPIAYFKNQFLPFENANLSIATHALHYGTGAFGGLRGIPNPENPNQILLFRLDRHCQRLSNSARLLNFELPADKIQSIITDFVKKNQPKTSFYIRPFVYTSDLGIAPRLHNIEHDFFVYGLELGDYLSPDGVSCRISSWYRQEDRSLPLRGKISGAYITSSLAKTEAVSCGFDEAILLNSQGKVSEASGMNIFLVRNGELITPGYDQDILEGITRDSVLTIARDLGIKTIERPVDKSELFIADEVFLSGTAAKVTPVKRIETFEFSKHRPVTDKLREAVTAVTENRNETYRDWVNVIEI
ncbi:MULTISPECIES: branched-chain amino acid transaminase [Leptolyngbya]|jgi:branched-chain amino acid aminotransferase|uniref:Branched-chain-amino-acid aminotransferase n=2 Tax=Leptolyngbya boryana TaxID=1184 RepID=A0A1Z4JHK9_LEPBY|nr:MULTISPECIES: branched-chain amino acid transaminase [Leptolyngbya]BAY56226.1 branched-chain amino acid aminotransferase [Leptolyngbya boryana NIES-2135]MBD1855866.1 branched-chain amino acid transaminase [Leptolyngbya sp. FACHB-1624]MBD2366333.1 branched-chain amino acid transaminase [Leptolyngbya sp. FACHB-161]MBD2372513.1 branched-chain amino acid transaminase [Leptolyngbya sp. FACHB-238]MBD2396936.1 branched-chain amino acid transaminase [Leptolyngbya sp. FACHB-239]